VKTAADSIARARTGHPFISQEDLKKIVSGIPKSAIEALSAHGTLDELPRMTK
jgi:DNA polymerase III alpha subunit (gram-positive type)